MNVRLDEFLILTRASYIFNILKQKSTTFVNSDGESTPLTNLDLVVPKSPMHVTDLPEVTLLDMYSNLEFILQCCIEGITIDKYIVCRTDKTMENIFIINFPHTRKDNGEVINVQIPLVITKTEVVVVSPFNAPEIVERFNSENEYVIGLLKTYEVYGLDVNNKPEIIKYTMTEENGKSVEKHIIDVLDAVATSIHMQTEYFIKDIANIQDTGFNVITEESKEFKAIYGKYGKEIEPVSDDDIPLTAYTPIIIKDVSTNKSLIKKTTVTDNAIVQNIVGIESFEEVNEPEHLETREILIRCPELTKPVVFKLPDDIYYVDYNEVASINDADVKTFRFLDTTANSTVNSDYIPNENYSLNIVGTEDVSEVILKANEKLLIPFKQFGIVKGTKLYELIKPVLKLPVNIIKKILGIIFSMFKTNSKLEKEKSIELREKLLNDELDTTMTKVDLLFGKYSLLLGSAFFVGGYIIGIIVYFIFRNRETNIRRKALERTERQVVSKIREYEKKIEFATQESDYPAVKKLSHTRDSYKAMLDKLREVKKDSLGKADKFTDTYSEYND